MLSVQALGLDLTAIRTEPHAKSSAGRSPLSRLFGRAGWADAYRTCPREVCIRLGQWEAYLALTGNFRKLALEL
jgi:hypothetical protein